jgi:glutathione S-transferase
MLEEKSMSDPIVYGPRMSTYVRSVRLALEEKGIAYHLEELDIFGDPKVKAAYLSRHPFGKVPAFEHDGFALYETNAIMRYVDEAFPGPSLQPSNAQDRARMNQVFSVIDSYLYPSWIAGIALPRLRAARAGVAADESAIEAVVPRARRCADTLDKLLDGRTYFAGDGISLADLLLAPIYFYFLRLPEGQRLLDPAANLARWWSKMSTRPSMENTTPTQPTKD